MGPKTRFTIAMALAMVAALVLIQPTFADVALGRRSYPAELSIEYDQKRDEFVGNLDTTGACERGRLVSVYRVRPGADRLVGKDRTDRRGNYVVENRRDWTGKFYALTRVSLRGDGERLCKGDKSDRIRVTEP